MCWLLATLLACLAHLARFFMRCCKTFPLRAGALGNSRGHVEETMFVLLLMPHHPLQG
jgi:hypothetical protein